MPRSGKRNSAERQSDYGFLFRLPVVCPAPRRNRFWRRMVPVREAQRQGVSLAVWFIISLGAVAFAVVVAAMIEDTKR